MLSKRHSEGSGVRCAFHPSFELGKVQKDAAIRRFAPDAPFQPNSTFNLVAHRVLAVASDFGKPLDEYPSAWIAHGVLPVLSVPQCNRTSMGKLLPGFVIGETCVGVVERRRVCGVASGYVVSPIGLEPGAVAFAGMRPPVLQVMVIRHDTFGPSG